MASKYKAKSKNKFVTIRVTPSILTQIERAAKEKRIEKSNIIREAIECYLGSRISLDLSQALLEQLDRLSKETGISRELIVSEAVSKYLWKARAEKVRERLIPAARKKGIVTDEDVFRKVS